MKVLIFYSGGKDSQACMLWAVDNYGIENCEAVFCDTGWENPVTYNHIKETCQQIGIKLNIIKSNKYDGMIDLAKKRKRFPSTKARFCTQELKSFPAIDFVLSQNENLIIIEGIRKNESFSRSLMQPQCIYFKYYFENMLNGKKYTYRKKDVFEWCKNFNADKLRPIFEWTAEQTLDFIKSKNQLPNPLYYQGFHRVGCFPCIMARQSEVKLIIENFPEHWERLKKHEIELGTTFFKPDYIPTHAQKNKKFSTATDIEKYLNDKNATLNMFEGVEVGCMSVYNLCE